MRCAAHHVLCFRGYTRRWWATKILFRMRRKRTILLLKRELALHACVLPFIHLSHH